MAKKDEATKEKEVQAAVSAYNRQKTVAGVARDLGISRPTARRRLKAGGVIHVYKGRVAGHGSQDLHRDDRSALELKLARQERMITNLRRELQKAKNERLTSAQVREHIIGLRAEAGEPPRWTTLTTEHSKADNVPVTMWSDFHWGEVVTPDQVFGRNRYNMDIAKERLQALCGNTTWLLREHLSPRDYPGLVLALAGDMVSGDIHEELKETNEQQMMPVLLDLYDHLRQAITLMADEFGRVFLPCVYGNHGRTNKKPQHKDQSYKNYDWLLYHLLADYFSDDQRVSFLIGDDDEIQFAVAGLTYRLTHGSQFKGGAGFIGPLAPITRGEHKKRIVSQSQGAIYDCLLLAHFHQCVWRPHIVVNGSLKGYDEFAADLSLECEPPKQMLWLTDPVYGKVSPMEVWTEKPGQSENTKNCFAQISF